VVVAAIAQGNQTRLLVAPITHTAPERQADALEIPLVIKRRLGLDAARSWIVLTELNRFIWPGPDVRIVPGGQSPIYDAIPDWLFFDVRDGIARPARGGGLSITPRTE
jgi:hypothetical protein